MKHLFSKTRTQIFLGYSIIMVIVLVVVFNVTYTYTSALLKENSEKYISLTVNQIEGRIKDHIAAISTSTIELLLTKTVQDILFKELEGEKVSLNEQFEIDDLMRKKQPFMENIDKLELFSKRRRLYPIASEEMLFQLDSDWIDQAVKKNGGLAWIENDTHNDMFTIIRQIKLIEYDFKPAGYLVVYIDKNSILNIDKEITTDNQIVCLLDDKGDIVYSSDPGYSHHILKENRVTINNIDYIAVYSELSETDWRVAILTPIHEITKGLDLIKSIIIFLSLFSILFFLVMSVLLSGFITKPITEITAAMNMIDEGILSTNDRHYHNFEINRLNKQYNTMIEKNNHLIQMVYQKEITKNKAEIRALQAQINPHFLFNTLESLYWSLMGADEEELAELVLALSNVFKYTIQRSDESPFVTMEQEIDNIQTYLNIMKFRMGERLSWTISIDEPCKNVLVPKLLLQPIVENAIKYGIEKKIGNGIIKVNVLSSDDNMCNIIIEDNGIGIKKEVLREIKEALLTGQLFTHHGKGIGLLNIQKRIQLNYGNYDTIDIESQYGQGMTVILKIPQKGDGRIE